MPMTSFFCSYRLPGDPTNYAFELYANDEADARKRMLAIGTNGTISHQPPAQPTLEDAVTAWVTYSV